MMASEASQRITEACLASFADAPDARGKEIAQALVRHLHAFTLEIEPTREEWGKAIEFLTRVGHTCVGARQEFILLSDVLGVSMLVETMNEGDDEGATESTVLGPFYVDEPPHAAQGADLTAGLIARGESMLVDVTVEDTSGNPVSGATVDIWQCAPDGLYDVQRDLPQGEYELRARFTSDSEGKVTCRSIMPIPYQVPSDGPVGDLLAATSRHPWRPAHVHFRIVAEGYETLTTHLFPNGDPYLESDVVFGVKPSLVIDFDDAGVAGSGEGAESRVLRHRFALQSAS